MARILDLARRATQTKFMAHIYLTFDFGKDEEKAQQARHKLDSWKQAFKLDKKMQGKFDRQEDGAAASTPEASEKPAKKTEAKGGKGKLKADPEPTKLAAPATDIKLILRLALPNHEKLTEQRILKRISTEEPFASASPKTIKQGEAAFADVDSRFEALE
ncbi:MAG: hypothetical protein NVS9B14_08440 [Candidatus Acidiferrum sp.]